MIVYYLTSVLALIYCNIDIDCNIFYTKNSTAFANGIDKEVNISIAVGRCRGGCASVICLEAREGDISNRLWNVETPHIFKIVFCYTSREFSYSTTCQYLY